jgi:hypothetical protein
MAILIHRKPVDLWRHLPEYVIVIVLAGYCSSVGSKVPLCQRFCRLLRSGCGDPDDATFRLGAA